MRKTGIMVQDYSFRLPSPVGETGQRHYMSSRLAMENDPGLCNSNLMGLVEVVCKIRPRGPFF
jgi:hypothetical protein